MKFLKLTLLLILTSVNVSSSYSQKNKKEEKSSGITKVFFHSNESTFDFSIFSDYNKFNRGEKIVRTNETLFDEGSNWFEGTLNEYFQNKYNNVPELGDLLPFTPVIGAEVEMVQLVNPDPTLSDNGTQLATSRGTYGLELKARGWVGAEVGVSLFGYNAISTTRITHSDSNSVSEHLVRYNQRVSTVTFNAIPFIETKFFNKRLGIQTGIGLVLSRALNSELDIQVDSRKTSTINGSSPQQRVSSNTSTYKAIGGKWKPFIAFKASTSINIYKNFEIYAGVVGLSSLTSATNNGPTAQIIFSNGIGFNF
jgi:hypothetical protein